MSKQYEIREPEILRVSEAFVTYASTIGSTPIVNPDLSNSDFFENRMSIINVIKRGLPFELFNKVKRFTPFSDDDWADYLNLSKKSLQRYENDTDFLFKPIHTEKIIELAEVTNLGLEVFDSKEQFYSWLNTPSFALGSLKPVELLKDSYGKELVMDELNRIDQGIFV